jgi:hypothetical protein
MWHQQLTKEQRIETLNQLALSTGYAPFAIEKDWWVCVVLRAVFQSKYKDQIIFQRWNFFKAKLIKLSNGFRRMSI